MSQNKAVARPRQVTMAVSMSVVGSLLLVASLFDTLGRLRTPEMRESIDEVLARPPSNALGVETAQVIEAMRVLVFISGALAAMVLVFAVFVLQRHRAARVGFTVAAVLLLATIPVAGLMPVLLAVAAGLIWSRPARDWYAGRPPTPAASASTASASQGTPAPPTASILSEQGPPRSSRPFGGAGSSEPGGSGQPPAHDEQPEQPSPPGPPAYGYPGQSPPPYPPYPPQYQSPRDPGRRPVTVTIAAALTWLGAGAVAAAMVLLAFLLATQSELFIEELDRATQGSQVPLNREDVLAVGWGVAVFLLVWSLIAMVLAVLAFRRKNAARIALAVSAVMAALLSLLMILSGISAVILLMAAAAAVLLFTGGANEWYSGRNGQPPGSQPGSGGYPAYPGSAGYGDPPQQPPFQPPPDAPPSDRSKPW